jgi:hypothetical protein
MASTLLLDTTNWDLVVDASGNIAVAAAPYALAQDSASAIKTFLGECWYDTTLGINWYADILGQPLSITFVKSQLVAAALTVPGVTGAQVFITAFSDRNLSGQVQVTDATGVVTAASF